MRGGLQKKFPAKAYPEAPTSGLAQDVRPGGSCHDRAGVSSGEVRPRPRGRPVRGRSLDRARVCSVGIMVSRFDTRGEPHAGFAPGPFHLLVAQIGAVT